MKYVCVCVSNWMCSQLVRGRWGCVELRLYLCTVCVCARLPHTPAHGTWPLPSHAASRLSDYFRAETATLGLG